MEPKDPPVFNSLGHPVPVIDGQQQIVAADQKWSIMDEPVKPFVLSTDFTDNVDKIVYNLKAAYKVDYLSELIRSITYSRAQDDQFIIVKDSFAYTKEGTFESPLITQYNFTQTSELSGYFWNRLNPTNRLYLTVYSEDATPFTMESSLLYEQQYDRYNYRVNLKISGATSGSISYKLTVKDDPQDFEFARVKKSNEPAAPPAAPLAAAAIVSNNVRTATVNVATTPVSIPVQGVSFIYLKCIHQIVGKLSFM